MAGMEREGEEVERCVSGQRTPQSLGEIGDHFFAAVRLLGLVTAPVSHLG